MTPSATRTMIGIVGFSPAPDCYPLGPRLLSALRQRLAGDPTVDIENMTWGPIHIVQRFQDEDMPRPDRLIVVGAAPVSREPGRVDAYCWKGGKLSDQAVQDRIYEAVTGVVDIENTLMIGEHFGIWPGECFVVEADLPADCFGRLVIAENQKWVENQALTAHLGFSPFRVIEEIADIATELALVGERAALILPEKVATALPPSASFLRTHIA
jgi:hypothetical protein